MAAVFQTVTVYCTIISAINSDGYLYDENLNNSMINEIARHSTIITK